jgi:hypothetical protein
MATACTGDSCLQRIVDASESIKTLLENHFNYLSWVAPVSVGIILGAISFAVLWKVAGKW